MAGNYRQIQDGERFSAGITLISERLSRYLSTPVKFLFIYKYLPAAKTTAERICTDYHPLSSFLLHRSLDSIVMHEEL